MYIKNTLNIIVAYVISSPKSDIYLNSQLNFEMNMLAKEQPPHNVFVHQEKS